MSKRASDEWALRIQLEKEEARVAELEAENERLRVRVAALEAGMRWSASRRQAPPPSGITERELRDLIFEFHPDRNPGGLDATVVSRALIRLRDKVRA